MRALRFATAVRASSNDVISNPMTTYRGIPRDKSTKAQNDVRHQRVTANWMLPAANMMCYAPHIMIPAYVVGKYLSPARDLVFMASTEVDLNEIPEGKNVTLNYRGKPLFVRHRSQEMIDGANKTELSTLRDPKTQGDVCLYDPKYMVAIAVCTHLGCIPIADHGDYLGGYYCPCHGSHYDALGRIRKGPAPLNLEVPPYKHMGGNIIKVGD